MKLKFYDTTIRFKAYFSYSMLRKEPFTSFCTKLENFPFNKIILMLSDYTWAVIVISEKYYSKKQKMFLLKRLKK